jgi:hypothetical protein
MLSRFMHLGEVHTLAWKIMFIYWLWWIYHPCFSYKVVFFLFVGQQSSGHQSLRENIRKLHRQRTKMRSWMWKMKMSMERPCVEPVERTMHQTNFGFAVTSARSGSMASVWRLLLLGLSILSSTSAHHAPTRELALDISKGCDLSLPFYSSLGGLCLLLCLVNLSLCLVLVLKFEITATCECVL